MNENRYYLHLRPGVKPWAKNRHFFRKRQVLGIVYRAIAAHLIKKSGATQKTARTGAVTLIQRFGSALNLNIHFHMLFLDGVYTAHGAAARFQWVQAPTQESNTTFREYFATLAPPPAKGALHRQAFFAKPLYDLTKNPKGKPIAVFFEQKDCAGCDSMHKDVLSRPATLKQLKRFQVIQLDRWDSTPVLTPSGRKTTAREWADELDIVYLPTMVLFDGGKETIRADAYLKEFHIQSVLEYVASGAYKHQPNLQRFIRERADRLREQGVAVDLWQTDK